MLIGMYQGIVLRTYIPNKHKLSVLDAQLGKIECIPKGLKRGYILSHGIYLSYSLRPWHDYYIIQDIAILDAPFYWAKENFLFFHHVLEICYYFLSINSASREIFELILKLYTCSEIIQTDLCKKIFLCHLFIRLGIYPSDMLSYGSSFFCLISRPLDSKVSVQDDKAVNEQIQRWLLACIDTHPYAYRLKTVGYIKKLDVA